MAVQSGFMTIAVSIHQVAQMLLTRSEWWDLEVYEGSLVDGTYLEIFNCFKAINRAKQLK